MSEEIPLSVAQLNLSPDAFHKYAVHYYNCKLNYNCPPDDFSPVPYFLLCRAIELEVKARHLRKGKSQKEVKRDYSHDLFKAYNALDQNERLLDPNEEAQLKKASDNYKDKGFEYFKLYDALEGFSQYPDLKTLDSIAKKLIGI